MRHAVALRVKLSYLNDLEPRCTHNLLPLAPFAVADSLSTGASQSIDVLRYRAAACVTAELFSSIYDISPEHRQYELKQEA